MRRALVISSIVLCTQACLAATGPLDVLREQTRQAEVLPPEKHAHVLVTILGQAFRQTLALQKSTYARREWEEFLQILQHKVAELKAPEARAVFTKGLLNMPPPLQALLLVSLSRHPPDLELDRMAHDLLKNTRELSVRVAAIDLLAAHLYIESVDDLIPLLAADQHTSIRISTCRALARLQDRKTVEPLIDILKKETRGRMRYEAVTALRALTGEAFGADASTWEGWWTQHKATFVPPPGTEPGYNWEIKIKNPNELEYYQIPLVESRVIFIMDISGSMEYGGKPCRLDKARDELKKLIGQLDPRILFNVILFSGGVHRWNRAALVPAVPEQKESALKFLDNKAAGGSTQTISALEEALWQCAARDGVETIFLLTDGAPTPMAHHNVHSIDQLPASNEAIRQRIHFINQFLKVRIHTIGVYTRSPNDPEEQSQLSMKDFLTGVASDNDGVYVEVK